MRYSDPKPFGGWRDVFRHLSACSSGMCLLSGVRDAPLVSEGADPDAETLSSAEQEALRLVLHVQFSYRDQSTSVSLSGLTLGSLLPHGCLLRPGHLSLTFRDLPRYLRWGTSPRHSCHQQREVPLEMSCNVLGQLKPNGLSQPGLRSSSSFVLVPKSTAPWGACITTQPFQTICKAVRTRENLHVSCSTSFLPTDFAPLLWLPGNTRPLLWHVGLEGRTDCWNWRGWEAAELWMVCLVSAVSNFA